MNLEIKDSKHSKRQYFDVSLMVDYDNKLVKIYQDSKSEIVHYKTITVYSKSIVIEV